MNKKSIVKYSLLVTAASVMFGVGSYFVTQHVCESNSSTILVEKVYDHNHQMEVKQQAEREAEKDARLHPRSFVTALVLGDVEAVRFAVSHGVDVKKAYDGGWLPLCAAAQGGNSDCVVLLLAAGADPKEALEFALSHQNTKMIRVLLESGVDANTEVGCEREPAITRACKYENVEIVRLLLEKGATASNSALREAAGSGKMDIVQLLLSKGADPNEGLSDAVESGHMDIVQLMLEKGATASNSALREAAGSGKMDIAQLLLSKGADPNEGLSDAAESGHMDIVQLMLEKGATDYNAGISGAARQGHMDIVLLMLEKGADPNVGLEQAVWGGQDDIIKHLLALPGIDVEAYKECCERVREWHAHLDRCI